MYLNQVSLQHQSQQNQHDPYSVAALQQQQQQVLAAQQAALYSNGTNEIDAPQQQPMGHQQSASISNGFPNSASGAPIIGGLLAPSNSRGQHNRAVSLPVFAQQQNSGFSPQEKGLNGNGNVNGSGQERRGHQYQNSFSGHGAGFGNGFGLAIQEGGLNGWAEEEAVR
jgi:hypothetical protein